MKTEMKQFEYKWFANSWDSFNGEVRANDSHKDENLSAQTSL